MSDHPQNDVVEPMEFANAADFYHQFLRLFFARHLNNDVRWCAQWTFHQEAWEVVAALHEVYESLRAKKSAGWKAVFLRDWAYPLTDRLFAPHGTFAQCYKGPTAHEHHGPPVLPWDAPSVSG